MAQQCGLNSETQKLLNRWNTVLHKANGDTAFACRCWSLCSLYSIMSGKVLLLVDSNRCCQRFDTRGEMWIKCVSFSVHFECEMWMFGLVCWAVSDESCVERFFFKVNSVLYREMCVAKSVISTILKNYIRIIISGSTLLSFLPYVQDIQRIEMLFFSD